jgi:hypothetical protein
MKATTQTYLSFGFSDSTRSSYSIVYEPTSTNSHSVIGRMNPTNGWRFEHLLTDSLNYSFVKFGVDGQARWHKIKTYPDIDIDLSGAQGIAVDCRTWTATPARGGKLYYTREMYATAYDQSGRSGSRLELVSDYAESNGRLGLMAIEFKVVNGSGYSEPRSYLIPFSDLEQAFRKGAGVDVETLLSYPSFGKDLRGKYAIDPSALIDIASRDV